MPDPGYGYLYKPVTRKGPVFLAREDRGAPVIVTADGQRIQAVRADRAGGAFFNEGFYQYVFPREVVGLNDITLEYGGESVNIASGGTRYEGKGFTDLTANPSGYGNAGGGDYPSGYAPGTDPTGLGFYPADISSLYPSPVLAEFEPIETAPYEFTDPTEFARKYGEFARDELVKSNELSKEFAFDALDTELRGLLGYAPGAAALKRQETSLDNIFNLEQRRRAVDSALPFARGDLEEQRRRANIYARGGVPDEVTDRGLELGIRSAAADRAASGGFGAASSVSRRAQDLMTARERIALGFQGEQLLGQNIGTQAGLFLPPTEYSNAGQQINVMPSLSGSQLQTAGRQEITQFSGIPAQAALSTQVQQRQFQTNLEQQTRQFNAGNLFDMSKFNAGTQNQFALGLFDYQANLAGAIAGAAQTGSNTQIQLQQQQAALDLYKETLEAGQRLRNINSIFQGISSLLGSIGGITGLLDTLGNLFDGGGNSDTGDFDSSDPTSLPEDDFVDNPDAVTNPDLNLPDPTSSPDEPSLSETGGEDPSSFEPFSATSGAKTFSLTKQKDGSFSINGEKATPDSVLKNASQYKLSSAMRSAGLSDTPGPNKTLIAYDGRGKPVYANNEILNSNDTSRGRQTIDGFIEVLNPFGVFSPDDTSTLKRIAQASSDATLITNLTAAYQAGDKKAFANALLERVQPALTKGLIKDVQNRAGLNALIDSAQLFTNWDKLSGAQKSQAIASIGLKAYQFQTGENLASKAIVEPMVRNGQTITPGLTVGQALNLFNAGYNVYNLVDNWDQYSDIQKIVYGANTAAGIAATAESLGLLGGAASAGTAAGVGGAAAASGSAVGTGAAAGSAGGAAAGSGTLAAVGAAAGAIAGAGAIYLGEEAVRKNWGRGGAEGRKAGVMGGAAMAAGLMSMTGGAAAPVAAGLFAVAVLGTSIKTGKHSDQVARDSVRDFFRKKVGSIDDDFNVTLANGKKVNVGIDGSGGRKEIADRSRLVASQKNMRKLNAYDVDYTNDLDYASGMAGVALSRLVTGGKNKGIDQFGGQLGNAALDDLRGGSMTQENFNRVMENHRAVYAQNGIKSKADAYKLSIDMLNDGRINTSEAVAMQQAFNMMYDRDGFKTAQKLMTGRDRGLQVADEGQAASIDPGFSKKPPGDTSGTRRPTPDSIDPGFNRRPPERVDTRSELAKARPYAGFAGAVRTKEEAIRRNRERRVA